jgi:hypothetical protein
MFTMAKALKRSIRLKVPRRIRKKRMARGIGRLHKKHGSSKSDSGLEETNYLLRSPKNARRLLKSIEAANAGKLEEHELAE